MEAERTNRREFFGSLTNRVVGSVPDADAANAAVDALLRAGFDRPDIEILHGEDDLRRLDPTGAEHGLLAQVQRRLIRSFDLEEFRHLTHHVDDIRAGRYLVMVRIRRRALRLAAADILHEHGGEFVGFYGRWACVELPAAPQTSPQAFPALFARAWNDRNPDALASLFDEDGEFVNVTGVCWHDRESIRRAHAGGPAGMFPDSRVAAGDTKVKLLTPEIAVVHTRLTHADDRPDGAAVAALPRATIASFVVHRTGHGWLCASAHTSDVDPTAQAGGADDAGVVSVGT